MSFELTLIIGISFEVVLAVLIGSLFKDVLDMFLKEEE